MIKTPEISKHLKGAHSKNAISYSGYELTDDVLTGRVTRSSVATDQSISKMKAQQDSKIYEVAKLDLSKINMPKIAKNVKKFTPVQTYKQKN
jgi:hypothetical protein